MEYALKITIVFVLNIITENFVKHIVQIFVAIKENVFQN